MDTHSWTGLGQKNLELKNMDWIHTLVRPFVKINLILSRLFKQHGGLSKNSDYMAVCHKCTHKLKETHTALSASGLSRFDRPRQTFLGY
jgi:hypothetical protein